MFYFEWNKTDHAFAQNAISYINVKGCQRAQEAIELLQKWLPAFLDFLIPYIQVPLSFFLPGQDIYLGAAWLFVGVPCALWLLTTQVIPLGQENHLQM